MDDVVNIQAKGIEILKVFISLCGKHNLRYYLLFGTCLGAVRHNGFIPWDDDIDVGMPRKDYIKFAAIAVKELPSGYFYQNHNTDKQYSLPFAKLRDSNTSFIESSSAALNINHGLYIDIFPLDGISKNKLIQKYKRFHFHLLYVYCLKKYALNRNTRQKLNVFIISCFFFFRKTSNVLNSFEKKCLKRSFDSSEFIVCYEGISHMLEKYIVNKNIYGVGVGHEFCGMNCIIPSNYKEYLSIRYGKYLELPPESERFPHHNCIVIDMNKSYLEYIKK